LGGADGQVTYSKEAIENSFSKSQAGVVTGVAVADAATRNNFPDPIQIIIHVGVAVRLADGAGIAPVDQAIEDSFEG